MYEAEKKQEVDISIHSLRMEGDFRLVSKSFGSIISIHSLRMEGDFRILCFSGQSEISIHSLRMEGDP